MKPNQSKVFGIGLSKTGTTSLARALEILGYKTKDNLGVVRYDPGDLSCIDSGVLDSNDAFTDTPIPSFYRELDRKYPESKFILTVRDTEGWLKSCKKQFTQKLADKQNDAHRRLFLELYDCDVYDEQKFKSGYEKFFNGVMQYFEDRPQALLILNISAGDGWEELCSFLKKPTPVVPFPRANVTQIRWLNPRKIVTIAEEAGQEASSIFQYLSGRRRNTIKGRVRILHEFGYLLPKLICRMRGDNSDEMKFATNASQRVVMRKLKRLTPDIPIVTPETSNAVPYSERCKWNHFWLVSCIGGDIEQTNQITVFTLSVALVEDGTPILGVVHAPAVDTTYYATTGKGAFKLRNSREPKAIMPRRAPNNNVLKSENETHSSPELQEKKSVIKNNPYAMCLAAEGKIDNHMLVLDSFEWETAAVNVILNAIGIKVINYNTKEELTYNKKNLDNGPISFL